MAEVYLASKTLAAINHELEKDGGARWRGLLRKCMAELEDAYRDQEESHRSHMGASSMAKKCGRAIWYSFRWATRQRHEGRMIRLFNRGHMEEGRLVALLLLIGCEIWQLDENGKQYRISDHHGHYGGSGDGIGRRIPDLPPDEPCVTEFKTHNEKSFLKLQKDGVKIAKPEHWGQMQQYMRKFKIRYALYIGVNKNNDDLYCEIVVLDDAAADQLIDRANKLIWLKAPPMQIGNPPSAGNFDCRWCDHRAVCFSGAQPDRNCRTCSQSEPVQNGSGAWFCHQYNALIPKETQYVGCDKYSKHPHIGGK